jgi:hypothetical protein
MSEPAEALNTTRQVSVCGKFITVTPRMFAEAMDENAAEPFAQHSVTNIRYFERAFPLHRSSPLNCAGVVARLAILNTHNLYLMALLSTMPGLLANNPTRHKIIDDYNFWRKDIKLIVRLAIMQLIGKIPHTPIAPAHEPTPEEVQDQLVIRHLLRKTHAHQKEWYAASVLVLHEIYVCQLDLHHRISAWMQEPRMQEP